MMHWMELFGAITVAMPAAAARRYAPTDIWQLVRNWIACHTEVLWVAGLLLVVGLAHGINMFHYPYFEDDEGTYMAQAWSVLREGLLEPYTYWYDHAPAGWFQIGAWTILTLGFHTFGSVLDSGRVLMLLFHLGSCLILYGIARRLSGNAVVPTIAVLLFSLSPFGIYFQRRVLLDNITDFWMLVCIFVLLSPRLSLTKVWLSGLALGVSILSKEVTLFLIPVLAYLVFYRTHRSQRAFATVGWLTVVTSILSLYVLMAALKGELFPQYSLLGGTSPHVSLLGTLQYQASRGKDGGLLDPTSQFYYWMGRWARETPTLLVGGTVSALLSLLAIRANRLLAVMGMITLSLIAFLARGGEVIEFYLVPLLPLFALNLALLLGVLGGTAARWVRAAKLPLPLLRSAQLLVILAAVSPMALEYRESWEGLATHPLLLWQSTQADAQSQALAWVEAHIPAKRNIVIDNYMYTDLHDGAHGTPVFPNANYYWKVQQDPAIEGKVFHDNWKRADYVVTTIQMLQDMKSSNLSLVSQIVQHSVPLADFDTGGWPIEVRKVVLPGQPAPSVLGVSGGIVPSSRFYFAGGVNSKDADTTIHLTNPNLWPASVQITFFFGDGATNTQGVSVDAFSQKTVRVSDIQRRSGAVGFVVNSSRSITAFATVNTLGTDSNLLLVSKQPATQWNLSASYTGLIATSRLSILNPDPTKAAHVKLRMRQLNGSVTGESITVGAHSTSEMNLHPAEMLDITVQADRPVAVDRTTQYSAAGYASASHATNQFSSWATMQAARNGTAQTYLTLQGVSCSAELVTPGNGLPPAWPDSNAGLLVANCHDPSRLASFLKANNLP